MTAPVLKTSTTRVGPVVVCAFTGDMIMDNEAVGDRALRRALAERPGVLALDLARVDLFTSSALSQLVRARRTAAADGIPLVLVAPSPVVRRVLSVTEAAPLFPTYPTVDDVIQAHVGTDGNGGGRQ
ncbi:STAS domain-containing protein [Kitasatospora sp. NPDC059571]|uniref:STAS domain-containing protein n=1 Tax=Kitasatospora sp. NPDC059571 TaxID=3346871 RepID=UPI003688A158